VPDVGIHRKGKVNLPKLVKKMMRDKTKIVGAIGCFIGVVRGVSKNGERVRLLSYEYSDEAVKKLREIATKAEKAPGVERVMIHHVVGSLRPGDEAIYVVVSGNRRREVFAALPKIMDRVKKEVPIWKKEVTRTKEYWAHEG